jgi:uncharacterized Rossmann fold enzyme
VSVDPEDHYEIAKRIFDLDERADARAARELSDQLVDHDVIHPSELADTFDGQAVPVLGPKPGGAEDVDPSRPIVAAGSAVRQALSAGVQPTLVVSDLDGSDMGHKMFSSAGVPTAVHAHSDNAPLRDRLLPQLDGPVFGTCQNEPPTDGPVEVHRFGGFSDGDRACFVAYALGADSIELYGWDFEDPVGGAPSKQKRLDLAKRLIDLIPIPVNLHEPGAPNVGSFEELDLDQEGVSVDVDDVQDPESGHGPH